MASILLVTSSPRGDVSRSTAVAHELAGRLRAEAPGRNLVHRDLVAEPLAAVGPAFASGIYTAPEARTESEWRAVALSDRLVDELFKADRIVIGAAMINFGIPAQLKTWFDHVVRAGRTFRFTDNGPEGLVHGKKAYLVVASGGVYSEGPAAGLDHAVPYLETILSFIGISDIELVRIEGTALGEEAERRAVAAAKAELPALATAA